VVENTVPKQEKTVDSNGEYEVFLADLPENDCRFAIYDFEYSLGGGEGERYNMSGIRYHCGDGLRLSIELTLSH
jgi:hypothetical protein